MEFTITKVIAVTAETPEEAVQKINEGKTISFTVNPRPQPQNPQGKINSPALAARTGAPQASA